MSNASDRYLPNKAKLATHKLMLLTGPPLHFDEGAMRRSAYQLASDSRREATRDGKSVSVKDIVTGSRRTFGRPGGS
jgi:hypothetical protein